MAIGLGRGGDVAGGEGFGGDGEHFFGMAGAAMVMARAAHEARDKRLHLALGKRAHEAVHRLAILEGIDGGDGLDAQLLGDFGIVVDIDLDQLDGAAGFTDDFFQHGAELLAGPAPGRPEIHDHRNLAARLQHIGGEGGEPGVLDMGAAAARAFGGCRGDRPAAWSDQGHEIFREIPPAKMVAPAEK